MNQKVANRNQNSSQMLVAAQKTTFNKWKQSCSKFSAQRWIAGECAYPKQVIRITKQWTTLPFQKCKIEGC
jgi:hypothetical protein